MATTTKWTAYATADTAIASASLSALAGGSYVLGAAIDNSTDLHLWGDLEIVLSSAVTTTSGAPYVAVYLLPSQDGGTEYPTTNGSSTAGATANSYLVGTIAPPASTLVKTMALRGIALTPGLFKIMIQNNLGAAFPSTSTSTVKLRRYSEQGV